MVSSGSSASPAGLLAVSSTILCRARRGALATRLWVVVVSLLGCVGSPFLRSSFFVLRVLHTLEL